VKDHDGFTIYGSPASKIVFLQLVDGQEQALPEQEAVLLSALSGETGWCLAAVPVGDWNQDLTPWNAPPVFGKKSFGNSASKTLNRLTAEVIPAIEADGPEECRDYILCGYSLAGLFSLWAACQTDMFSGIVAASPSVWYPDWMQYAGSHRFRTDHVYLSLGDREARTRNPVMARVADNLWELYQLLSESGLSCMLDWNSGNHFADVDRRMAKGMAWMLKTMKEKRAEP